MGLQSPRISRRPTALYPYYLSPLQEAFGTYGPTIVLLVNAGLLVAAGRFWGPDSDTHKPLR